MTLPNFLHIGTGKAATSWLWRACQEHPQIFVPPKPDNVNFFTVAYHRGLKWYENEYFSEYSGQPAIGEFSNSYQWHEPAMQRIARDLPDVKLATTLRHPVERAFLSWAHHHLKNKPSGLDGRKGIGFKLEQALHHHGHVVFNMYLNPGFYARHLENVFKYIPRERVHVTLYEDLAADNAAFLSRYFEFLGVDPNVQPAKTGQQVNADSDDTKIEKWLNREVIDEMLMVFREDTEKLEDMIDRDLSSWKTI